MMNDFWFVFFVGGSCGLVIALFIYVITLPSKQDLATVAALLLDSCRKLDELERRLHKLENNYHE